MPTLFFLLLVNTPLLIGESIMDRNKSKTNAQSFNHFLVSPMGAAGYKVAYGVNAPNADFVSKKDKEKKKNPSKWGEKPFVTVILMDSYRRVARLVNEHYRSAVGRCYNMSVVLSVKAYLAFQQGKPNTDLLCALAVVWRLLYEGLGLAGWTPPARLFMSILVCSSFNLKSNPANPQFTTVEDEDWVDKLPFEWWPETGIKPSIITPFTDEGKKYPAIPYMVEILGLGHLPNARAVCKWLIWACKITLDWGAIEAGRDRVKKMSESEFRTAVFYGGIRRACQGHDNAIVEQILASQDAGEYEEGEVVFPQSCIDALLGEDNRIHPWVEDILGDLPSHEFLETIQVAFQTHRTLAVSIEESLLGDNDL